MSLALKQELETVFTANLNPLKHGVSAAAKEAARVSGAFGGAAKNAVGAGGAFGGAFQKISSSAKAAVSNIVMIGGALTTATLAAAKLYAGFEKNMAAVWTLTDWSKKEWASASQEVLKIAGRSGQELETLTKGLYDTISAQPGITREDSLSFLEQATKTASAGATNTATAVDALTSVVNSYGEMLGKNQSKTQLAQKASDILFSTMKYGKTNFSELAGSIGRVAALGALSGVQFEELGAALATATLGGLKTDEAVTSLRQILVTALNPTKESADEASRLGLAFDAQAIKAKGLYGWLRSIDEATKNLANPSESLSKLFGNVRAFSGAAIITKMKDMYSWINTNIKKETNTTQAAFEKMADTYSYKWDTTFMKLKGATVNFGRGAVEALTPFFEAQQDSIEKTKEAFGAYEAGKLIVAAVVATFYELKTIILELIAYGYDYENVLVQVGERVMSAWQKVQFFFESFWFGLKSAAHVAGAMMVTSLQLATESIAKLLSKFYEKLPGEKAKITSLSLAQEAVDIRTSRLQVESNLRRQIQKDQEELLARDAKRTKNRQDVLSDLRPSSMSADLFRQADNAQKMAKAFWSQAFGTTPKSAQEKKEESDLEIETDVINRLKGRKIGKIQGQYREYDFSGQPFFTEKPSENGVRYSGGPVNVERQKQIDAVLAQVLSERGKAQEFEQRKTNFLLEKLLAKTAQGVQAQEKQPAKEKKFFISVNGNIIADR